MIEVLIGYWFGLTGFLMGLTLGIGFILIVWHFEWVSHHNEHHKNE